MAMHKNCIKYLAQPQAASRNANSQDSAGPKGKQCNFNVLTKSTFHLPCRPKYAAWETLPLL